MSRRLAGVAVARNVAIGEGPRCFCFWNRGEEAGGVVDWIGWRGEGREYRGGLLMPDVEGGGMS